MAQNTIPRKAIASSSQSPEPAPTTTVTATDPTAESTSAAPATAPQPAASAPGIKRKPVDGAGGAHGGGAEGGNRLSGALGYAGAKSTSTAAADTSQLAAGFSVQRDEPTELRFALGPGGVHAWYDPTGMTGGKGRLASWSAHGALRKAQIGHEGLKDLLETGVQNIQLLQTSPGGLTMLIYTDQEGNQQTHCEMPLKTPMSLIGPGKHTYQKCEEAHGTLLPWVTACMVNGVPVENIQVAFGPDDAYFACEPVKRKAQNKLIVDLQDALNQRPDEMPAHVAMGVDNTWSVIWSDGAHSHYLMPNTFPTLCELLHRPELPRLKRIMLSTTRHDEFAIEYENGHYFLRARLHKDDVANLDQYLKLRNGRTKVIILGVDSKPLKGDFICRPFVLPVSDFASTPYGELSSREGHLAEWREHYNVHELTSTIADMCDDTGACSVM